MMLFVVGLVGCAGATPQPTFPIMPTETTTQPASSMPPTDATTQPTPFIAPTNVVSANDDFFPRIINCSNVVLTGTSSFEWNGLKIGITSQAQLEAFTAPSAGYFDSVFNFWRYSRVLGNDAYGTLEACFTKDSILSALNVYNSGGFPRDLNDWLSAYGKPDRVTWSDDNSIRSLIWYDKGILATYFYYLKDVRNVILFAPVSASTWENSWVFQQLPKDNAPQGDAFIVNGEDPWGVQK